MAHKECFEFVSHVQKLLPKCFYNQSVLDVGSLNINGSVRGFFDQCEYVGVDIGEGDGVDLVVEPSYLPFDGDKFDVVISTEMFEHNVFWEKTFKEMIRVLKPEGMMLFTCASEGRAEHGTQSHQPEASPLTVDNTVFYDYYQNRMPQDFFKIVKMDEIFFPYTFLINQASHDLYFLGFKRG